MTTTAPRTGSGADSHDSQHNATEKTMIQFVDHSPYRNDLGNTATETARRNLSGRTHYADPDTMAFFGSRVIECWATQDGHLLAMVESLRPTPDGSGPRVYRPVIFDRFGGIVHKPEIEDSAKTKARARRQLAAALASLDGPAITARAAERYSHRIQRETDRKVRELRELWDPEAAETD